MVKYRDDIVTSNGVVTEKNKNKKFAAEFAMVNPTAILLKNHINLGGKNPTQFFLKSYDLPLIK